MTSGTHAAKGKRRNEYECKKISPRGEGRLTTVTAECNTALHTPQGGDPGAVIGTQGRSRAGLAPLSTSSSSSSSSLFTSPHYPDATTIQHLHHTQEGPVHALLGQVDDRLAQGTCHTRGGGRRGICHIQLVQALGAKSMNVGARNLH